MFVYAANVTRWGKWQIERFIFFKNHAIQLILIAKSKERIDAYTTARSARSERESQSTCKTWIITIRRWVHRVIVTIVVFSSYVCVQCTHAFIFVYTCLLAQTRTQYDYIILVFTVSYGAHRRHNAISAKCQKQISFYRIFAEHKLRIVCQHARIQPNTKCVGLHYGCTIWWWEWWCYCWLSHSVRSRFNSRTNLWSSRVTHSITLHRNIWMWAHTQQKWKRETYCDRVVRRATEKALKKGEREPSCEYFDYI